MPDWMQQLWNASWGSPSPSQGEGMEVTIVHTWPLPVWMTLLFLLLAFIYVLAIYFHEPGDTRRWIRVGLALMRIALIGLVITMMYGWMRNRYRTNLPDLVIAMDDSESMTLADSYAPDADPKWLRKFVPAQQRSSPTRFDLARALLLHEKAKTLRWLAAHYNVKFYWIGPSARVVSGRVDQWITKLQAVQPAGRSSRLGRCLYDILLTQRGRPTAAVVVLTDGVTTEGKTLGEVAGEVHDRLAPMFFVGLGDEHPPLDVRLADMLVDEAVFLGDLVHFDVTLAGTGFTTRQIHLQLRQVGRPEVLAEKTVALSGDGRPQQVRLSYRPEEQGDFQFVVQAETLQGEANQDNNRMQRTVRVRDEAIRVLLIQEYPSYEFRYLKTLLQRGLKRTGSGKAIQLTTVLQEADAGYVDQDETARRAFPVSREELYAYDVVIFGDVNPSYFSRPAMENLASFVQQRGGGLVVIAGPRHTPLAYRNTPLEPLFPCDLDTAFLPNEKQLVQGPYRVHLTQLGMSSPELQLADNFAESLDVWSQLPPLRWLLKVPDLRPAARVLVASPGVGQNAERTWPVICTQFVGAGQVLFHATDETYLWARYQGSDRYYERYWLQAIRSLSHSKLLDSNRSVDLVLERNRFYRGEAVRVRVQFLDERMAPAADDGVAVIIEREGGRRQRVTLRRDVLRRGTFETSAQNLTEGTYRAWVTAPVLSGQAPARHFTIMAPPGERARLEMDAADLRRAAEASNGKFYTAATASHLLRDLPRGRQVRIETLPSTPVWNSPWLAALAVLLLVSEWLIRRWLGWL